MSSKVLVLVASFFMLATFASVRANADDKIKLDAEVLLKEYEADREGTLKKYQGKSLEITGWVRGTANASAKRWEVDLVDSPDSQSNVVIACFFNKENVQSAKKVTVRRKVTISAVLKEGDRRLIRLHDSQLVKLHDPETPPR